MKKCLLLFLICLPLVVFSQRHELGVFGGTSYYLGDLNPDKQFSMTRPAFGLMYKLNLNKRFVFRLSGMYGTLTSADSIVDFNQPRNLSFKSPLLEISAIMELNYYNYQAGNDKYRFSPYLFYGISFYRFKPMAELNGNWYNLQVLGTEGQGTTAYPDRKPYSLAGISIPFGMGLKFNLGGSWSLGLEWGMRKTFTDYLDDVSTTYADPIVLAAQNTPLSAELSDRTDASSTPRENTSLQRGDAGTKDWYSIAGFTLTFRIKDKSNYCSGVERSRGNSTRQYFKKLKFQPNPNGTF